MELQRPRVTPVLPQWDLGIVLEALSKPPYEPLREASFKHLTLKTVFLLAMASAGRCSELHALRFDQNYIQFKPKGAGALFQKVISENRIRSGLREVVGSVYENLTAITERDGTLSEACRKYSSDCLQNMIQNELKHFETVANVSFLQEIVTFALLKY